LFLRKLAVAPSSENLFALAGSSYQHYSRVTPDSLVVVCQRALDAFDGSSQIKFWRTSRRPCLFRCFAVFKKCRIGVGRAVRNGEESNTAALRRWCALILILVCFVSNLRIAKSANLALFSDAPTSSPLVITPLDASSRRLLVSVVNDTDTDPPHSEFMSA
jgi:hypothetical protein